MLRVHSGASWWWAIDRLPTITLMLKLLFSLYPFWGKRQSFLTHSLIHSFSLLLTFLLIDLHDFTEFILRLIATIRTEWEKSGMLEQGVKRSTTLQLLFSKLMMVVPVGSLSFSPNHRPHHLFLSMKRNMCLKGKVRCRCSTFQSVDEHKYTHHFNLCSSACLLFSQTEDVMTDWLRRVFNMQIAHLLAC